MFTNSQSRIKSRTEVVTVADIYDMLVTTSSLNPDPLYQRSSTISSYQHDKNVGIILSIFNGFGIDTLIVRDISGYDREHPIRVLYPNYKYLVIDAGHRCRAVKWFIQNKFYIILNGVRTYYRDLNDAQKKLFLETDVLVKYVECTSEQARELFLVINKMTKTTEIETIMADDVNPVCRWVREHTWFYSEYDNRETIHPIFKVSASDESEHVSEYWNKPNTGGSFFYHTFITLAKSVGRGNVNAGQRVWEKFVADEINITSEDELIWTKFFDDLREYQKIIQHKDGINDEIFGFFSCVWFELLSRYGVDGFKLDMNTFAHDLSNKRVELVGKSTKNRPSPYDDKTILNLDGKDDDVKSTIREYIKAFAYGDKMSFAGKYIISQLGDEPEHFGVTVLTSRKSLSSKDRQYLLSKQRNLCYIDGKLLKLEDAHAAHIIALSKGGTNELSNLKMVRKEHNTDMGSMPLEVYKEYYLKTSTKGKNKKIAA